MDCKSIFIKVLFFLSLSACTSEIVFSEAQCLYPAGTFNFTAIAEGGVPDCRTSLGEDGVSIVWQPGDTLLLAYRNADGSVGTTTARLENMDGGNANFSAELPATARGDSFFAAYGPVAGAPFDEAATVAIPKVQQALKDGFDPSAAPMTALWTSKDGDSPVFRFKNEFSLICLEVESSEQLDSVALSYTGSGPGRYTLNGPVAEGGKYYICVPPSEVPYSNLRLDFYSGGEVLRSYTNPHELTVERNHIYPIGEFTPAGVPFGTSWGSFFLSEYAAEYVSMEPFTSNGLTLLSLDGPTDGKYAKGKVDATFTVAQTGVGLLTFSGLIWKGNKGVWVYKTSGGIRTTYYTRNSTESAGVTLDRLSIPIDVKAGDVINIHYNGSSGHRLNFSDSDPLKWERHSFPLTTIHLLGASTTANQDPLKTSLRGWGQIAPFFFDTRHIRINNCALSGSSSKSYRQSQNWVAAKAAFRPGDIVTVSFGINDRQAVQKGDKATTPEEFCDSLRAFIRDIRAAGCRPVFITPIVCNQFENGEFVPEPNRVLRADLMREVSVELGVPIIESLEKTTQWLIALGEDTAPTRYCNYNEGDYPATSDFPAGRTDKTHLNQIGAWEVARLTLLDLVEIFPELKQYYVDAPYSEVENFLGKIKGVLPEGF